MRNKTPKRLLSLVLTLLLVVTMLPAAAFAQNEGDENDLNYVVLGSSQTNGYGLRGYVSEKFYNWTGSAAELEAWNADPFGEELATWNPHNRFDVSVSGYRNLVPESYPDLIGQYLTAEGFDVTTHQLALSSMRAEELTVLLDSSFDGDEFTDWRFSEDGDQYWFLRDGGLEALRADYQKTISEADVITYDLGANNFGAYLANQIASPDFTTADLHNVIDSEYADLYYSIRSQIESSLASLTGESDFTMLNNAVDTLAYSVLGFCKHFDLNMQLIYSLNPDVDITVVSIQNTLYGCDVTLSGLTIPLGELLSVLIGIANNYTACQSEYCDSYAYANLSENGRVTNYVDDLKAYAGPEDLTQNLIDCLNTYDNHLFLSERVTQTLEEMGYVREDPENTQLYETAYTAAYDTAVKILQRSAENESVNIAGLTDGKTDPAENILYAAVCDAAVATVNGESYEDVLNAALESYEEIRSEDKGAFTFEVWVNFGNSFFAHPSPAGCREAADIIYDAMKNNTSGRIAVYRTMLGLKDRLIQLGTKYGSEYALLLTEKLSEAFGLGDLYTGLTALLPKTMNPEYFANLIMSLVDNDDAASLELLEKAITEAEEALISKIAYGDINMDGEINVADLYLLRKTVAGFVGLSDNQKTIGDIYVDGKFNALDINLLRRYLAGIVTQIPVNAN